jgi:Domain of unknown function (DUF4351)
MLISPKRPEPFAVSPGWRAIYRARMPSQTHEVAAQLFRNQPQLVNLLLRDIRLRELPEYEEARPEPAELPDLQPTEYRADAVIALRRTGDSRAALAVIVEIQLRPDDRKRYTWPVYLATLRARLECPVYLLVVTHNDTTARWCGEPIDLGGGRVWPQVAGPAEIPQITDVQEARANPELAVLSAMAHGYDKDFRKAAQIAEAARQAALGLDYERAVLYLDIVLASLSEAARGELSNMKPAGYEFQSEFVRTHFNRAIEEGHRKGLAEGRADGRAALIVRQLTLRFGPLTESVRVRIPQMSVAELDVIGERLLTAPTLEDALEATGT